MVDKQKDIVWILLDSLRIDYLNLDNLVDSNKHYIEKLLYEGMLFTNVTAAVKFSLGAGYALGTGLYGSVTGMIGHDYDHSREKYDVLFVGDYLKKLGYHTFHYTDFHLRHFPSSGIDVYEFYNYPMGIGSLPGLSFDIPLRRQVIKSFKNAESPKFLCLQLMTLHNVPAVLAKGKDPWLSEIYIRAIQYLARDLRIVLKELELTGDELLVLLSDHGVILDKNLAKTELQEGTSMKPESIRTFCSFISSDITPSVIGNQCSSIDILPTIFDLAGLSAIPVQGKLLVDTAGTETPICEGVAMFEFPFDQISSKAYSICKGDWKLVVKSGWGKKLYRVKDRTEKEVTVSEYPDVVQHLESKAREELSTSANEVRIKKMIDLKSQGKEVLSLTRNGLPVRIVLFLLDNRRDSIIRNLKSQMEHYFDLHIFDKGKNPSKKLKEIDTRINVHNEELRNETVDRILRIYTKKPEFVGFVKSSIEYYDDYLYRLRKLLETNPQADIAFAELKNGSESVFLVRAQLVIRLIKQGMKIEELLLLSERDGDYLKVEYKCPLGTHRKKKLAICPLDKSTIELLRAEGIEYIEPESVQEKQIDIIACSSIKNVQTAQDMASSHQAIAAYIDYDTSTEVLNVLPSITLKVIKRKDAWYVMDGKTKITEKRWLWQAFEECVTDKKYLPKNIKGLLKVKIIHLGAKISCLPIFNSYIVRKLFFSICIGKFELIKERPPVLKRQSP